MKVAVITPPVFAINSSLDYGGLERFLYYCCKALTDHMEVVLFAPEGSAVEGVKVVETVEPGAKWDKTAEQRAFDVYKDLMKESSVIWDHTHEYKPYANREHPIVHTCHGVQTQCVNNRNFPCLTTISRWHSEDVRRKFGFSSTTVPLCIDFNDYGQGEGGDGSLLFGLLAPHKGQLEALEVLGKVKVAGEDKFVPDISYPDKVKEKSEYLGQVKEGKKRELLCAADCVIINSKTPEAFSMLALESMACGTPVLFRKLGVAEEMIEDGMGFVYENEKDLPEMVERCKGVDRKRVRHLAKVRWDASVVAREYAEVLKMTVDGVVW